MTIRASHFGPEVLLSAPRRSSGVPNASGTHVLFTVSTYSFETHKKTTELRVLDTKTNENTLLLSADAEAINWLDEDSFVWLQGGKAGTTDLYHGSLSSFSQGSDDSHYEVSSINAPAGNLKVAKLSDSEYAVVLSAQSDVKGELFNPEKADKPLSSGKLYTSLYVRHWDEYEGKEKNALWYGKLSKSEDGKQLKLSTLTNALKGTKLECPMKPFGSTDNFDLSSSGIVFVSKDPDLNPALNTKCNVYLLTVDSWTESVKAEPKRVTVEGFEGASTSPVFSPDELQVAFLSMRRNGYESDQNRIFVVGDLDSADLQASNETAVVASQAGWDRSPSSISWTADGKGILAIAEDVGHARLYLIAPGQYSPLSLTKAGSVGEFVPLQDAGRIFFSGSSLIDNSYYGIVEVRSKGPETISSTIWSHSNSSEGSKFGLKTKQVSSIWTPASNPKVTKKIHSWVLKPSNFDSSKRYPVAFLIHGGPQGAWGDSWSTRWNPAVFAEQGFIVVAPNITGSTGYGQAFTDAINRNWGGDPYGDLENVFDWVSENLQGADVDRAVALGASYGGYMINCKIPPESFKRKALAIDRRFINDS